MNHPNHTPISPDTKLILTQMWWMGFILSMNFFPATFCTLLASWWMLALLLHKDKTK